MANNNIGGFFVTLGMKVDESFKKGEEALSNFIGTGTKAAAALIGISKVAGTVENSNLKLAKAIGISGSELKAWQDSASKAGINAGALTSSMAALQNKMQKMKYEGIDANLAEKLGMLGIGYGDFAEMDATQRIRTVFEGAEKLDDQSVAAALVGDTLGSAAREYYDWLSLSGRKLDDELSASRNLNFTTDETMKSASAFNAEFNGLLNTTKSISLLIGSKIGEQLTPILRKLQEMLRINKEFIASGLIGIFDVFKKIGSGIGQVFSELKKEIPNFNEGFKNSFDFALIEKIKTSFSTLASAFEALIKTVGKSDDFSTALGKITSSIAEFGSNALITTINMIKDLINALTSLLNGDWKETGENLKLFFSDFKEGAQKLFVGNQEDAMRGGSLVKGTFNMALHPLQTAYDILNTKGIEKAYNQKYGKDTFNYNEWTGKITIKDNTPKLDFKELDEGTQTKILKLSNDGLNISELYGYAIKNLPETQKPQKKIQDGIIAPGGRVTQVAQDDWVLAAKDLGVIATAFNPESQNPKPTIEKNIVETKRTQNELIPPTKKITKIISDDLILAFNELKEKAMSFIPSGITNNTNNSSSNYTINQNFSFSGTGRELIPAVQKEAYAGTQSAISAAMKASNQRMQLMNSLK